MTPFSPDFIENLPWWAVILIMFLILLSAFLSLSAGVGLVRFRSFYSRIHTPAILVTLASLACMTAAIIFFSFTTKEIHLEYLVIIVLLIITTPIASVFLIESARHRDQKFYSNEGLIDPSEKIRQTNPKEENEF